MTNLYVPSLRAMKLSAAVGSGKTRAAVAWIADPKNATRNVLYVAPTRALIDQTAKDLRVAIAGAKGDAVRNVNLIHADTSDKGQVQADALGSMNAIDSNEGAAQLLTTQTFLAIVSKIKRPDLWTVVLDEAFNPATFETIQLGVDALKGWEHFSELFKLHPDQGHRIMPREGCRSMVDEVAVDNYSSAGDRFKALAVVARSVSNPAIRCELVLTDGARALLSGKPPPKRRTRKGTDKEPGTVLQFASYVDPTAFAGFREVLFLSALFEQTILYNLWTKALGVTFEEHPEFPSHLLRDTHKEQGRFLAVGHLLHKDDRASMENLGREALTGRPGGVMGTRVIDHLVMTAATNFGGEKFLLQTNAKYGYTENAPCLPRTAVYIPTMAHGLNTFQGVDNVAALAVTNPNPQQLDWIRSRTGMRPRDITQAFRIHAQYQALGRCSIRKAEPTSTAKVVLVVGADDARFIHDLFPGSHFMGQVGGLPNLSELQDQTTTKEPGKAETLAKIVLDHLKTIPQGTDKVTSRGLKADVERRQLHLIDKGADEEVCIPSTLWTRALSLACVLGQGWQRQGQCLHRLTAAHYGFENQGRGLRPLKGPLPGPLSHPPPPSLRVTTYLRRSTPRPLPSDPLRSVLLQGPRPGDLHVPL